MAASSTSCPHINQLDKNTVFDMSNTIFEVRKNTNPHDQKEKKRKGLQLDDSS